MQHVSWCHNPSVHPFSFSNKTSISSVLRHNSMSSLWRPSYLKIDVSVNIYGCMPKLYDRDRERGEGEKKPLMGKYLCWVELRSTRLGHSSSFLQHSTWLKSLYQMNNTCWFLPNLFQTYCIFSKSSDHMRLRTTKT